MKNFGGWERLTVVVSNSISFDDWRLAMVVSDKTCGGRFGLIHVLGFIDGSSEKSGAQAPPPSEEDDRNKRRKNRIKGHKGRGKMEKQ